MHRSEESGKMEHKTLTKAEIVDAIYEQVDMNRAEIKSHVESLLTIMKDSIKRDHNLLISGFGKFEAYEKDARKGRNPQTSETITLPPRKVVVFRLSRKFRSELNNGFFDGEDDEQGDLFSVPGVQVLQGKVLVRSRPGVCGLVSCRGL
eukprot:TRINITY_DN49629_c0_g1_i1.p2 TRINITY_DN49629_c0_g1~~TRINITY_DN49629_c0_g1_i1.p2  ORF type:complete len:149 (+),score=21.92 TRINITY_DN49629_c0_g1_i1:519-965(+)